MVRFFVNLASNPKASKNYRGEKQQSMKSRSHDMIFFFFSPYIDLGFWHLWLFWERRLTQLRVRFSMLPKSLSPQKLIPLAGLKHPAHGPRLCCKRRLKPGVWAGVTHRRPPLSSATRAAASMAPAPPKPPQFSSHRPPISRRHHGRGCDGGSDLPACQGHGKWPRTPPGADTHIWTTQLASERAVDVMKWSQAFGPGVTGAALILG